MPLPERTYDVEVPRSRRYLVGFTPHDLAHYFTDVLVIGGGLAGVRAALEVQPPLRVTIVTKDSLRESASTRAQGGIASVLGPEDRFQSHIEDTLAAGKGLCEQEIVEMVVREGPARVQELVAWGTRFDRVGDRLALTREGGHTWPRVVHALGDATGKEVMRAVIARLRERPNVRVHEHCFTLDLLTVDGVCRGALIWDERRGFAAVWAKATILATGGAGRLYRETTNPKVATGDGFAMAFRAGCTLRDLEFVQFHPTALYIAGSARHLITEAVRGEGAYLRDVNGYRFMSEYHPNAELASRDDVSRAITRQMEKTQHPCVYLDLRHLDASFVRNRFPGLCSICAEFGLDPTRDLIPVRPAAHYTIGGVKIDADSRTDLEGLWACGEVTSSGLHGANRLASNSLLEGLVFGARAGADAARAVRRTQEILTVERIESGHYKVADASYDVRDLTNSVQSLMTRSVGIERRGPELRQAIGQLEFWTRFVFDVEFQGPAGWELQNILTIGGLIARSALVREESRGCHYRSDFPDTDDSHWRCHLSVRPIWCGHER